VERPTEVGLDFTARPFHIYYDSLRAYIEAVLARSLLEPTSKTYFEESKRQFFFSKFHNWVVRKYMLQIRREQMQVFNESRRRQFEVRAVDYLKSKYPGNYQRRGEDQILQLIRKMIDKAKGGGLDSEVGVIACVELSLLYGEDFDQNEAWAYYIIHLSDLDPDAKIKRLENYIIPEAIDSSREAQKQ
jgi:hypothetical protein